MTTNDIDLNAYCQRVRRVSLRLEKAMADGRLSELAEALGIIHDVSRNALWRINDMQYRADKPQSGAG